MTQEEKELLLKDICARLPYVVKGIIMYDKGNTTFTVEGIDDNVLHLSDAEECYVEDFKPYFRPMSDMSEEEREEYFILSHRDVDRDDNDIFIDEASALIEWLNAHHFDYRELIEKGLALEAPKGIYD